MQLERYVDQRRHWPTEGRVVLAHHDDESVVVYQAFRPQIGDEALRLGRFGPSFSRQRMSWIKPNFLWMMYRCGWATKVGQERVLAVWLTRSFFEKVLTAAVSAQFEPASGRTSEDWARAIKSSHVRLQWDPDHDPSGRPVERRALQLGLRRKILAEYADSAILRIEDMTAFVHAQRPHAHSPFTDLLMPVERPYVPRDPAAAAAISG